MPELNRRDFMIATAVAACAACTCCGEAEAAETPASAPAGKLVDVGTKADYPKDGTINDKLAKPKETRILVVRNEGKIYAMNSTCPHKNYAVKAGTAGDIVCPGHGSKFTLRGTATKGPAKGSLFRYGISVDEKGRIMVDKSKQFAEKQWEEAGAFIPAT